MPVHEHSGGGLLAGFLPSALGLVVGCERNAPAFEGTLAARVGMSSERNRTFASGAGTDTKANPSSAARGGRHPSRARDSCGARWDNEAECIIDEETAGSRGRRGHVQVTDSKRKRFDLHDVEAMVLHQLGKLVGAGESRD